MAARRSAEFGERDSSYALPQRERVFSKDREVDTRNATRMNDRDFRGRDRGSRVRQKDIKERDSSNGDYRSSSKSDSGGASGGGGGGPIRCGYSVRLVDREPGELSSESGSDGAVESESHVKSIVASKMENGTQSSPVTRKRKFSPIVWDRDDQGAKGLSNDTKVSSNSGRAPPSLPRADRPPSNSPSLPRADRPPSNSPSLPRADRPPSNSPSLPRADRPPSNSPSLPRADLPPSISVTYPKDNLLVSPVTHNPETSLSRGSLEHQPTNDALSEAPIDMHGQSSHEWGLGNNEEAERLDEEDYITTRNISSSRWAGDADSPADEGEIFDDEDLSRGRKTLAAKLSDTRLSKKSTSPEPAEVKKETFESIKTTDNMEGGVQSRPSSGDHGSENGFDGDDVMEVDHEKNSTSSSPSCPSRSDTDSEEKNNSRETSESPVPPQRTVNMLQGCRSVDEFERLNKIDEGTYGVVYRARDKKTGEVVALKKVKMEKEREGFPMTSLREINILLSFHHPSIVDVKEVVVGSSLDSIFMVMEYMEHDLKALMETMKQPFSQSEVKCLMLQLLEGINYLHDNWVLHRDLKTSNLLLNNRGELKICDFGLARQYGSPLKPYTRLVVTLWYRSPELLLGAKQYSTAIDMWSLGCIMAELLSKEPLFNGKTEFDQLDKIFRILGTPNEDIWPGFSKLPGFKVNFVKHPYNQLRKKFPATSFTGSPVLSDAGFDLLNRLLTYDPEKRITAEEALHHDWFSEVPLPKSKEFMPTFPAQHAQDRRMRRVLKSPDPLEEQRKRELHQAEFGTGGLFG